MAPTRHRTLLTLNLLALGFCAATLSVSAVWLFIVEPSSKALPSAVAGLASSPHLLLQAAGFLAAMVGLHLVLATAWYGLWRGVGGRSPQAAVLTFLVVLGLLLLGNSALFPASRFAIADIPALPAAASRSVAPADASRDRPDVILIGIDSLRLDHLGQGLTPALDRWLAEAAVVGRAWTPLGRTFPAWVSVLTGQYPVTHGARFNLSPRRLVDDSTAITHALGDAGYQRVYAIDETRFSNLDERFGFDTLVTPAIGALEFVAGPLADQPLVNLVSATRVGRALFPFVAMNRGLPVTYRPQDFDRALVRALAAQDAAQPLFLVAHFELPHWPYTWADPGLPPAPRLASSSRAYQRAIARADRQVAALLDALEHRGRLSNALVVVLSDHGEGFRHSAPTLPGLVDAAGHGTSVLDSDQNAVLLAFRGYGPPAERIRPGQVHDATISLVDIAPTLVEWLGLKRPAHDGVSLARLLEVGTAPEGSRTVLIETGFSPPSVTAGAPDVAAIVSESARYYDVTDEGRLELGAEWWPGLLAKKQRAAVSGRWMLAALPGGTLIVADIDANRYWDLSTAVPPDDAPLLQLRSALCRGYEGDIGFDATACTDLP